MNNIEDSFFMKEYEKSQKSVLESYNKAIDWYTKNYKDIKIDMSEAIELRMLGFDVIALQEEFLNKDKCYE
jgi:hypothetical protein